MADVAAAPDRFDLQVETLIIGAGAAGLVAALSAMDAGQSVLVVEADPVPRGSTALSAGLIPAAGTQQQIAAGIADSAEQFAQDIQAKAKGENDPDLVVSIARNAAEVIDWLTDVQGLNLTLVTDFDYPGHSARRMHGLPSRSGRDLIDALRSAAEAKGIDLIPNRRATTLLTDSDGETAGVIVTTPDGGQETIGCVKLILACNGFGGNREMVHKHMPGIMDAVWFGHDGNRGEAVQWAQDLGAQTRHLGAYQGHGNVAHPHGILITWAVITSGGVQVNRHGQRFWDESQGYSEAARAVLAQPDGAAWALFDDHSTRIARQFEDFQTAEAQGAILTADTWEALADLCGLPVDAVAATIRDIPTTGLDGFGRLWPERPPLKPPFCAVRVTGALFHTQGGLVTDGRGRVQRTNGTPFARLFAAGGAACGVSGAGDSGYLSGNGLLTAVVLGRQAGLAPTRKRA